MAPDLRRVHETDTEIRFEHPHARGWLIALVGAALIGVALLAIEGGSRWVALALGGLFLFGGVSSALHRMELMLHFGERRFTYRRGRVFNLQAGEGSFDEIEAVVLEKELERRGSDRVDEWEVELVIRGWPRPVEVLESKDEATARGEAERLARRLGVELRERTTT